MTTNTLLPIERLLDIEFISNPTQVKYPLPIADGVTGQFSISRWNISREMIGDILTHRIIKPDVTPSELKHKEFRANRRISLDRVRKWQDTFLGKAKERRDVWNPDTPPGIVFSPDGFVLDAQHKLSGAYLAGIPSLEIPAVFNSPWSTLDNMDTPLRRNAGQMSDVPHSTRACAMARYLTPVIYGNQLQRHVLDGHDVEIAEIVQTWPWFRDSEWIRSIISVDHIVHATPLGGVVFAALAAGADPFRVNSFIRGIDRHRYPDESWEGPGDDPRLMLARKYAKVRHRKVNPNNTEKRSDASIYRYAMACYLDEFADGAQPMKKLQYIPPAVNLVPFWNSDKIVEFHNSLKGD